MLRQISRYAIFLLAAAGTVLLVFAGATIWAESVDRDAAGIAYVYCVLETDSLPPAETLADLGKHGWLLSARSISTWHDRQTRRTTYALERLPCCHLHLTGPATRGIKNDETSEKILYQAP